MIIGNDRAQICDTLTVTNSTGSTVRLSAPTVFRNKGVTRGYLDYLQVYDLADPSDNLLSEGCIVLQYWVTPDGLMVTGIVKRTVNNITNQTTISPNDVIISSTVELFTGNPSGD